MSLVTGLLRLARSGLLGRAGWSFGDQALSSLSNAALSLLMAKATDVEGYGAFAVSFTVFTFLGGISKALVNNPYLMRFAAVDEPTALRATRAATGLALVFGLSCTALLVPVAAVLGGTVGEVLAVTALLLPLLFVQDVCRALFVARRQPRRAALDTAVWTVGQFAGMAVALALDVRDPVVLTAIWGAAGWIAALLAVRWSGGRPAPVAGIGYLRDHSDLTRFLVAEWLTVLGAAQAALLLVGALGSAADVGSLRAAQTLLGPLTLLVIATFGFLLPELVRRPSSSQRTLRLVAGGVSAGLGGLCLAAGLGLLALPEAAGRALLGEVWPGARDALPGMILWMLGAAVAAGPLTVIRACGQARASFGVNALIGVLMLVAVPLGFHLGAVVGAAWGFALANLGPSPLFWLQMERVLRQRRGAGHDPTAR